MPFPSPLLSPPSLSVYEFNFGGITMGGIDPAGLYQIVTIDGLDGIPVVGGDTQRPLDTGMFTGIDVGAERDITITMIIRALAASVSPADMAAARYNLATNRQIAGSALGKANGVSESPFWYQSENLMFCCMARPEKYNFTVDLSMVQAAGGVATALLRATDPRLYVAPTKQATVGLPVPAGGLTFPVVFNASFGGGGSGGDLAVINNGYIEMRPVIVITGPCTNPMVTNTSINGSPSIGFDITLNAGDTLTIDTDFQTAVLKTAGSTQGVSRANAGLSSNVWWNLPPGINDIVFTTSDGVQVAGTCTIQSADAYPAI